MAHRDGEPFALYPFQPRGVIGNWYRALEAAAAEIAELDGELVVPDERGHPTLTTAASSASAFRAHRGVAKPPPDSEAKRNSQGATASMARV